MPSDQLDVAVVGGGPAGLFAALSLLQSGQATRIKVFERSKGYRPCGAGITVDVNGMKAVKAVDPDLCIRLETAGIDFASFEEFDQYGEYTQGVYLASIGVTTSLDMPQPEYRKIRATGGVYGSAADIQKSMSWGLTKRLGNKMGLHRVQYADTFKSIRQGRESDF